MEPKDFKNDFAIRHNGIDRLLNSCQSNLTKTVCALIDKGYMTMSELARYMGTTVQYIDDIINGKYIEDSATALVLISIGQAYGIFFHPEDSELKAIKNIISEYKKEYRKETRSTKIDELLKELGITDEMDIDPFIDVVKKVKSEVGESSHQESKPDTKCEEHYVSNDDVKCEGCCKDKHDACKDKSKDCGDESCFGEFFGSLYDTETMDKPKTFHFNLNDKNINHFIDEIFKELK